MNSDLLQLDTKIEKKIKKNSSFYKSNIKRIG